MAGLIAIGVLVIWLVIVGAITSKVAARVSARWRWLFGTLIFCALLVLPVADEIVGKWQFESICKQYAVQFIDEQHAMNRRVFYERRGADRFAEGTAVDIRIDPIVFRDAETNRVLVSYHTVHAKGGWLIRTLGISETNAPLLFPGACGPKNQDAFKKKFNITVIN